MTARREQRLRGGGVVLAYSACAPRRTARPRLRIVVCTIGAKTVRLGPNHGHLRNSLWLPERDRRRGMFKGLVLGILIGVLLLVGCTYLYFSLGFAPVATAAHPMPF